MKTLLPIAIVFGLFGCSSLPTLSKVAPTFCSLATSAEAKQAAMDLANAMPDGEEKRKALAAIGIADLSADAACVLVKAVEAKQAQ